MPRTLLAALLAAGLLAACTPAQPPKKKAERVAVNDPAKLKDDADFAAQGEYEGGVMAGGTASKVGIQLVARGGGKFAGKSFHGGLPGAGWDGKPPIEGTAAREGSGIVLKDAAGSVVGELANRTITLKGQVPGTLTKVERKSATLGAKSPDGAVVLFSGEGDEKNWTSGRKAELLASLSDGKFLTVSQTGSIRSKQAFGSFKAHLEFRLPWMPNSTGQGRGNSGVYVQDRYEIQVLDSFGLKGENNECGGIYTQHKPLVNMCLPPMQWQTYDIEFTAAEFEAGKKVKNARLTLLHNGVKVHDNVELPKECPGGKPETPTPGPFQLQDHGDPVVYRNIWVVEKK
jgi:hypothetical protein